MAKVLGPLHSDHVKGSVSGITFREYRGLSTTTRRPIRPIVIIRFLPNIRAILSYLSRQWGDLSADHRQAWKDYASGHGVPNGLGGTFILDGNQMHMKLNHTAIRLGGYVAYQTMPPTADSPAVCDVFTCSTGPAEGQITADWTHLGTPVAADTNEVDISLPFPSPARNPGSSRFRSKNLVTGTNVTCLVDGLQAGMNYVLRIHYVTAAGQKTTYLYGRAMAHA